MEVYELCLALLVYSEDSQQYVQTADITKKLVPAWMNEQWSTLSEEQQEDWITAEMNKYIDGLQQLSPSGTVIHGTWHKVLNS